MERVNCNICNIDNTKTLLVKDSYNIVQCKSCGLVYVNPRPTKEELSDLYEYEDDSQSPGNLKQKPIIKKFQLGLNFIHRFAPNRGKILDVGCATGVFLNMAKNAGWETYGIDINRQAIEYARQVYKLAVKISDSPESSFQKSYFDVVTMFDSIEHVPNPLSTLQEANNVTRPNGLLVITTPNIDGLFPKFTYFLFGKTFGIWEHPTPPGHIYQFSNLTIEKLLRKANWQMIGYRTHSITRKYTAGKLENAIIQAIKTNTNGAATAPNTKILLSPDVKTNNNHSFLRTLKSLPRVMIRGLSWGLILLIYPIAGLFNKGDSMIVVAKKVTK